MPKRYTHEELVLRACRWLRSKKRCSPVFAEFHVQSALERPDAIGWTPRGIVHVVEAKASRADFLGDRQKMHMRTENSLGHFRWYVAPRGLIRAAESLHAGILEPSGRGLRILRHAPARRMSPTAAVDAVHILRNAAIRHEDGVEWRQGSFRFAPLPSP